jgi:hypothetical protein
MNGGNGAAAAWFLWPRKNFCTSRNGPKTRSFSDFFRRISIECGFFPAGCGKNNANETCIR